MTLSKNHLEIKPVLQKFTINKSIAKETSLDCQHRVDV